MNEAVAEALKWSSLAALVGIIQWICVYSYLDPRWTRNQIGRSLVLFAALAAFTPVVFVLALFFDISRLTSLTLAWTETGVFCVTAVAMAWRSVIWVRKSREPPV